MSYERYHFRRIEAGLCVACGKQPARPNLRMCAPCAAKSNARRNPERASAWKRARAARGLCMECSKPRWNGYVHCEEHAERSRLRGIKKRAKQGAKTRSLEAVLPKEDYQCLMHGKQLLKQVMTMLKIK